MIRNRITVVFVLVLLAGATSGAAPTVDGALGAGEGYVSLGTNSSVGWGNGKAILELSYTSDEDYVYVFLECNSSSWDAPVVFMDFDTVTGSNNGAHGVMPDRAEPNTWDNIGDLAGVSGGWTGDTVPMADLDVVVSLTAGDDNDGTDDEDAGSKYGYMNWLDMSTGSARFQSVGGDALVDSTTETSSFSGPADMGESLPQGSVLFAYSDGNTTGNATGNEGWEIRIPRSVIGAEDATTVDFFVVFRGGSGWMQGATIPAGTFSGDPGNSRPIDWSMGTNNSGGTWTSGGSTGPQDLVTAEDDCPTCSSSGTNLNVGDTLCLRVDVPGASDFQWSKDGQPLEEDVTVMGTSCSALQITNVQLEDSGVYRVDYDDGSKAAASQTFTVQVTTEVTMPVAGLGAISLLALCGIVGGTAVIRRRK